MEKTAKEPPETIIEQLTKQNTETKTKKAAHSTTNKTNKSNKLTQRHDNTKEKEIPKQHYTMLYYVQSNQY